MKALFFDLDDTLYREMDFVESGFCAVARHFAQSHGLPEAAFFGDMMDLLHRQGRGRIFDEALRRHGIFSEARRAQAVDLYREHTPTLRLDRAVQALLLRWRGEGLRLGLITDGMASVQRKKIAALGLEPLMDCIICTDELGPDCAKPSTRPFEVALELVHCAASEAVYIGDNDIKDFVGANRLGMLTIQTVRYRTEKTPDPTPLSAARFVVGDLAEIDSVLGSLCNG